MRQLALYAFIAAPAVACAVFRDLAAGDLLIEDDEPRAIVFFEPRERPI